MSVTKQLKKEIEEVLKQMNIADVPVHLEPTDLAHGDYACNVAMIVAKKLGKNPKDLAQEIVEGITNKKNKEIEKVEVAGPGFINLTLSKKFFADEINKIDENYGKSDIYTGKKILVEHSSPNLFKPFHIGHMMNNAIGESLARLMKYSGAEVRVISYPSDISLGIAKAIFVILERYGTNLVPITDVVELGDSYTEGSRRYEEDNSIHERVKEIANNLFTKKESPEWVLFQKCKHFNMEYFESVMEKLGSQFDHYIYESEAGEVGKEIVQKNIGKVFTESEGAVVYIPDESRKDLNTMVLINSEGNPTYAAKDIGLLNLKFSKINPDISIIITDHEQVPHFKVVFDAAEKIEKKWATNSVHIHHGRMSFKGQKMSSRLGGTPLALDMIDVVSEEAEALAKNKGNSEQIKNIAIAAIKFAILRVKPGQNINFDPETSLSFEGDSGPYLQYTHARIQSLLVKTEVVPQYGDEEISEVERTIIHFPEIVEKAIEDYAPQQMVTYLLQVAQAFNSYYGANKISDSAHRLAVAQKVGVILNTGLGLLGIIAPDSV